MEFQRIHPFNIPLVKISVDASLLFKRGGQLCRLQSGGKESSWNYTRVLRHAYITRGTILLLPLFNNQLRPLLSKLISPLVYFPSFRVLRLHITGVSHVLHYHATVKVFLSVLWFFFERRSFCVWRYFGDMIAYRVFILEKYDSRSKVWNYFFISYEWIKFIFCSLFWSNHFGWFVYCLSEGKIGQDHWSIFKDHFIINIIIK